jgi:radical SAM superfamily enzyme YgiQ (UPF0313 family)
MKITLINPGRFSDYQQPLSLGYLASYVKKYSGKKHSIKIIDENAEDNVEEEILKIKPDIIGITATSPQILRANEIAIFIKKNYPNTTIIIGGVHVSAIPEQTFKEFKNFDIGVIGEGEITFLELIDLIDKSNFNDLKNVKGIIFRDNGKTIITEPRPLIGDIDSIPFPARHLMKMKEYYLKPRDVIRGVIKRTVQIMMSRGCPYRCIFCASKIIHRSKFRMHSAEYVINEIEHLINKYKIEALYFVDDIFTLDKEKIEKICNTMIDKGINEKLVWEAQLKANLISKNDIELLKLMKKAGCIQVNFGFESGNDRVLGMLKKNTVTVKQNSDAIKICKSVGFRVLGNFIIGSPTETLNEINDTKRFILTHNMDTVHVHLAAPFPGTELWDICKEKGLLKNVSWENLWLGRLDKGTGKPVSCSDTIEYEKLLAIYREIKLYYKLRKNRITQIKKAINDPRKIVKWTRILIYPLLKQRVKTLFTKQKKHCKN